MPARIIQVLEYVKKKVDMLQVDQLGDQVFEPDNSDDLGSQELKQTMSSMKLWVSKCLEQKPLKKSVPLGQDAGEMKVEDKSCQVELITQNKRENLKYIIKESEYEDIEDHNFQSSKNIMDPESSLKYLTRRNRSNSIFAETSSLFANMNIKPFEFSQKREGKSQSTHPVNKILEGFLSKLTKKSNYKYFKNMRTYPVSMLMKIIKEVTEKASQIES